MDELLANRIRGRSPATAFGDLDARTDLLPWRLKRDGSVRAGLLRRLAASPMYALGARAGVLKAAERRSGRCFRLDVRQRVVVKALVSRHQGVGAGRTAALAHHIRYLGRTGAGEAGVRAAFFDRSEEGVSALDRVAGWGNDRHHFRFIISPEHGDRLVDLPGYVREVMGRVADDLGEPQLDWLAVCHFDTAQPHAHVLVRGLRADGRDMVIPRTYIGYGIRARAQELAQERLGDLSRVEAERRVWRETEADRFTALDRRLLAAASADGVIADGVGRSETWAALTRGRLRHLERLGLATRQGANFVLSIDTEARLRQLQLRRDIIRTLNQRRLESGEPITELSSHALRGRVVRAGFHDELGAAAYVIVRDGAGAEHYARLRANQPLPALNSSVLLSMTRNGASVAVDRADRWLGL